MERPAPDYSVIVPAYNEAAFLPDTLQALSAAMADRAQTAELIVVDNNSNDETADIATTHGARVVFEPVNQISRARNAGAAVATGRYLIFVDADTIVGSAVLSKALAALSANAACGGGARIAMDHPKRLPGIALAAWNAFSKHTHLAAGCFLFCRRDAFEACGGFSEKVYASEEIWLSIALTRWGRRHALPFTTLDEAVCTSARKIEWLSTGAILRQILVFLVYPLAVRSKRFCDAWYVRPDDQGD